MQYLKDISITRNDSMVSYNDNSLTTNQTIIFIHGFPFNKSMWDEQAKALNDKYRVIAYDVRGHGNSSSGTEDFSMDIFADDLIGLMDKLKIEKAILCGLSMGGYIALNAIAKHPKRFEALVLCDTQCIADTSEAKEKRMKTIENIKEKGVENFVDESIKNLFAAESFTTKKKEIATIREMMMNTSKESLCKTILALANRKETCTNLKDIKVPVLILVGAEDKITPLATAQLMHEKIQGSALSIIPHAGHVSNIENFQEFNMQLQKFL